MKSKNREVKLPMMLEPFEFSSEEERFAEEMGILDDLNIENILEGEELEEYLKINS